MKMIIEDMQSHYLNRKIRVNVVLPENYERRTSHPVLYLHDGQNMFDLQHHHERDWFINRIFDVLNLNWIIVAVDSPDNLVERVGMYYPWEVEGLENYLPGKRIEKGTISGGHAGKYRQFFVHELIPQVEDSYLVSGVRAMVGSSFAATVSLYIANKHPIFQYLGIFSPAFWFDKDHFLDYCQDSDFSAAHIYMSVGTRETSDDTVADFPEIYVSQARGLAEILGEKAASFVFRIEEDGSHDGRSWHNNMRDFVQTYLLNAQVPEH